MAKGVHVKQHTRINHSGKRNKLKASKNPQSATRSLRLPVGVEYAGYSYHGELTFDSSTLEPIAFDLLSRVGEIVNPKPVPLEEMRRQIPLGAAVYDVPVSDREGVLPAIGKALFRAGQCLADAADPGPARAGGRVQDDRRGDLPT